MLIVTIKVKGEATTFTKKDFVADDYNTSKGNPKMVALVEEVVKESQISEIDDVIVTTRVEW